MSEIAYANQEEMFVIAEDTEGVLKKPTASDRMYSVGPANFEQSQEFLEDEQIRATASRLASSAGRIMPGDFNFDSYIKPSGTLGTAPEHAALYKALMGTETVNAGVDVQYTLANELPSISVWIKKGHSVYALKGATVESASVRIAGDERGMVSWNGHYMRQIMAGTAYTASIAGAVLTMAGDGAQRFSEGAYIEVGTDDNGGAGFKILKNEPTAKKLTLDASPSPSGAQEVTPWWPSAGAEVGSPAHGKLGKVTIGGKEAVILTAEVTITNNIKYYIDEKNNSLVAQRYGRPKFRSIEGSLELYFLKRGASYFYRSEYLATDALIIPCGKVAGKIMKLSIPYAEYRTPTISGDEEFIETIPFMAIASSSLNDELSVIFQ